LEGEKPIVINPPPKLLDELGDVVASGDDGDAAEVGCPSEVRIAGHGTSAGLDGTSRSRTLAFFAIGCGLRVRAAEMPSRVLRRADRGRSGRLSASARRGDVPPRFRQRATDRGRRPWRHAQTSIRRHTGFR
jgi:hypothetical protein